MAMIRWQPFREMETLRRQFDELFDELTNSNLTATNRQNNETTWMPSVELQDTDNALILRAQIPGVDAKDLDVQVTREAVSISGEHRYERKHDDRGFFRTEFRYGKFQRIVPLPVQIRNEQVQADYTNGILTLTLPKFEEATRKVVKVNLGGQAISSSQSQNLEVQGSKQQAPDVNQTVTNPQAQPNVTANNS